MQYLELTLDVEQKLHLLMRLANNCELQASDADFSLRERAAGFWQELLVEMVNLEKEVSRKCAACQEVIDAHNPSQPHQGDDKKKKKDFTSFCQPTQPIACANHGDPSCSMLSFVS